MEIINPPNLSKTCPVSLKHLDASLLFSGKSAKSEQEAWFNYAINMQKLVGAKNNLFVGRVFPDTTVIIKNSNANLRPWIHGIAVVLDPTDDVFLNSLNPLANFTRANKFRVDSLALTCIYRRHINDPIIVDTLKVEVITNVFTPTYYYKGQSGNYGYDTVRFLGIKRDAKLNYAKPNTNAKVITKKILLSAETEFDTIPGGWNYIIIPLPEAQYTSINSIAIATFRFIPGYYWVPNKDTLNTRLNEFLCVSFQENGPNTYVSYTPKKFNMSYVLGSEAIYKPTSDFYKLSMYIPTVAFNNAFSLQNHIVDFKFKTNNADVAENYENTVKLCQNVPNPACNSAYISYELKAGSNVNIVITDITGRKVMEFNEGFRIAGNHLINVNTTCLGNGMYYYTLNTDNEGLTRTMIINK
jgi:hypothetical protein